MRWCLATALYLVAGAASVWFGMRLAFLPVATTTATAPGGASGALLPACFAPGIIVLLAVLVLYGLLGAALVRQARASYGLLIVMHVLLTLLTLPSVGMMFMVSSLLLIGSGALTFGGMRRTGAEQ